MDKMQFNKQNEVIEVNKEHYYPVFIVKDADELREIKTIGN
jgi:hypothetical protein